MPKITKVWAREIIDSKARPTIEVACQVDTGHTAISSVPAGTSTGSHEALELRDSDLTRYFGFGVLKAVENVNKILGPAIIGLEVTNQQEIDKVLINTDGTQNKSKYGANAILAISEATCKAAALSLNTQLYVWIQKLAQSFGVASQLHIPTPMFNMINGGLHGAGNLDFQEFHVIPASNKAFSESLRCGCEIYMSLGKDLKRRGAIHSVGDEGGYAPNLFTNADALEVIYETIKDSPYQIGRDLFLGLDVAATIFYKNGNYTIRDKPNPLSDDELLEYYKFLNNQYHLALLEDPFHEDAWGSWSKTYQAFQGQLMVVGDDLLATNPERVEKAILEKSCDAILVKPNQIGTVTETLNVIKKARGANWKVIVSHRSGETNDWFIADFAVGVGADLVKFGAPVRGERVAKYNRLLSIEVELQNSQVQK